MPTNPFLSSSTGDDSDIYDDGPSVPAGNNPFLASLNEQAKRRKKDEEARYNAQELKRQDAKKADQEKAKKNAGKNILERTGDVVRGTGNFIKAAAKDVKDTTVGAWQGVNTTARGIGSTHALSEKTAELDALNKETSEYTRTLAESDFQNPEVKKHIADINARRRKVMDESYAISSGKDAKDFQNLDSHRFALEAGESVINFGTLGLGTPIKAALKQSATMGTKAMLKQATKSGGLDLVERIVRQGGDDFVKDAAQQAIADTTRHTLEKGTAKLGERIAADATVGAAYGGLATNKDHPDASLHEYLINAAFGAGIGGALPVLGVAAKKSVQKMFSKPQPKVNTGKPLTDGTPVEAESRADLNRVINQTIDEQSDKYGTGAFTRIKSWVGDQVNPNRAFAKVDDQYAKANGIKRTKLSGDESLEDLARRSHASEREAAGLFEVKHEVVGATGETKQLSAKDLVMKYGGDSEAGKEFNNYGNAKFDLEFRQKHPGKRIQAGFDDDELNQFVSEYEARNPEALADLKVKKAVNDQAVDYMVKSKVITEAEGEAIKGSYEHAVPLERVFPDDLVRPEVTGRNIGSISKQTVIQRLEGGSDIPLSNSFDTMLNRVYKAVSQGNRAKLAQKLLERHDQGLIQGGKLVVTAGNKEARATIREQVQLVNKGVRYLDKKVTISNRQMRKLSSEINKLEKSGLNISLKEGGKDALPDFTPSVLRQLKDQTGKSVGSRSFFKALVEADPADLAVIRRKLATREPKLVAKLDEVTNLRTQIDALKSFKNDMKGTTAEFMDDPTTGKQIISGVIDGQTYKMEVPPDLAKAVMGMDQKKLPAVLKAFAIAKKPFEVAWTGVLNPVFSAVSFAFYDTPMSIINSPQGFKTLAPKAVIESIKSIRSSSEFQQRLAAEGARPYGGSGASAFIKPSAQSIAAQRSLLANFKYTSTHPEVALSKLDVWGGKLANSTRTRVARAAYDDSLRLAKKAGQDVKDPLVQKRAMENATLAYRTIMPDFDTMSNLTREINSVVPFYAASVAGTRSFGQALRRAPMETSAKALALGIAPAIGITAFSLMQPAGQEFYKDMEASGNKQMLDNNMIVVLPGAHKDDATGEWKGIVKVPLAPEFRAINQTVWRETRAAMGGEGPSASHVALSLFDAVTGGVRTGENPLLTTQKILAGQDPRTGERIIKGDMQDLPLAEQRYDTTSAAGTAVGKVLHTSPIQGDKLLSQVGLVGQTAKNGGHPVEAVTENVKNRAVGAFGEKASTAFFNTYSPIKARRDKVSKEVTDLVKQGKPAEARRKARDFNETLSGSFSSFDEQFGSSDAYDKSWDDLLNGLMIKTSDSSFKARYKG